MLAVLAVTLGSCDPCPWCGHPWGQAVERRGWGQAMNNMIKNRGKWNVGGERMPNPSENAEERLLSAAVN